MMFYAFKFARIRCCCSANVRFTHAILLFSDLFLRIRILGTKKKIRELVAKKNVSQADMRGGIPT
jgi:hypothetical protein